jgi:rhodanese-related sulfurtransferase
MGSGAAGPVAEVGPRDAWKVLSQDEEAILVDVRSAAEWSFVGGPDLSGLGREPLRVEWQSWPGMARNEGFVDAVLSAAGPAPGTLLFLCRSGARSRAAGEAVRDAYAARGVAARCLNVTHGFEGDLDGAARRGALNGWKMDGLPWGQN